MTKQNLRGANASVVRRNKIKTFFMQPHNVILIVMGILCTLTTFLPFIAILEDSIKIHAGTIETWWAGKPSGYSFASYKEVLFGELAKTNLWTPLFNTIVVAVLSCVAAILFGGVFAFLVTRTNLKCKKYLSAIFIFPYIMPQWTLAMVWKNMFNSAAVTGGADGLLASLFGIRMPLWWCQGIFPCIIVLGLHYSAFAYILIGGIFRNMDANLEEAATILDTPKYKTMFHITLPMVKPAILSTVLLVFGSSMGSYPVPHYLNLTTLSTKYIALKSAYTAQSSILAILMILMGVVILIFNQRSLKSRKNYTTVTGKSGQISKINLGKVGKYVIAIILIVFTFFTSIYPMISFAFETFLPNPGDYSFLKSWNLNDLTTKWWTYNDPAGEAGLYGQLGILYNKTIWKAYGGTMLVSVICALISGTLGTLIGYAVSKRRRSKYANYVNNVAFIPYLMPSIAVGIAFFKLLCNQYFSLYNTYTLLIIAGVVKYIPFASRSSLNSMLQLSGEIEESAIIQDVPWIKRMFCIIIPIQKTSILSGFLLPFITCIRELSLFMMLSGVGTIFATTMDYFDEMGLAAFSSGMNLILIVTVLVCNAVINKLTGASLDKGIGG